MSAKTRHPRTSTARCSQREQRRRTPGKRRPTRALAVRRVDSSRVDAPGPTRLRRGGPPGSSPRAPARGRGLSPADARSMIHAGGAGCGPRRVRHGRPAGAAGAGPGEREQTRAVRSSAAPLCIVGVLPPRDRPREGGPVAGPPRLSAHAPAGSRSGPPGPFCTGGPGAGICRAVSSG